MASATVEDYLKHIYLLEQANMDNPVAMGRLATTVGVAPGTATAMIKTLANAQLVNYEPRGGVRLTSTGQQMALHVVRRHRLVELLLVEVLSLDWSLVHHEAEQLEHAISDIVLEKIDALLGYPTVDPHGDPIPTAKGHLKYVQPVSLTDCKPGQQGRIARVSDQDTQFLQFAERHRLTPGMGITIDAYDKYGDAVTVSPKHCDSVTLGTNAASKIFVVLSKKS